MIGLVDESLRQHGGGAGFNFLAVARVRPEVGATARATLRDVLRKGQRRFHWRTDSERDRLRFLEVVANSEVGATVVYQRPVRRRKQEQARVRCLWEAMGQFGVWGIERLLIESRGEPRDSWDRREVIAAQQAGLVPKTLTYRHEAAVDEPLLWIADAVAGAMSAAIAEGDECYVKLLPEGCCRTRALPAP